MEWTKQIPETPGRYLRRVDWTVIRVVDGDAGQHPEESECTIAFDDNGRMIVDGMKYAGPGGWPQVLAGQFFWKGPLPEPPK